MQIALNLYRWRLIDLSCLDDSSLRDEQPQCIIGKIKNIVKYRLTLKGEN